MKFRPFSLALSLGLLINFTAASQDFSNKGKEFWLAYCYHVGMVNAGGFPTMTLYITSDVNTNYTVQIYNGANIQSGNIVAGQVVNVIIPTSYFIDNEGLFTQKTIRVTSDKGVVVYSYITRSAASGATLCLPTNVLGKEYYSTNFTQASNEANANSYFTIIAVEDNTSVEITPSTDTKNGWLANSTHTVNLNKGEIYQVLAKTSGNNGGDLTGSKIRSIASGTGGCKRIAVFSGSGKIRIPASCSQNSSDNLYQQLYPTGTWGKKYLTVPSFNNPNNYFRIIKSDPTTNVYLNGTLVPAASFTNNIYYQFLNNIPNKIEADKPISVAQYFTTQGCDGNNGGPYDPDMIMLNPVEQNIDKVTLVSSNVQAANPEHHIHVIMKNGGTGMSSFTFDGAPPSSSWTVLPADPSYSYLYLSNVSQGYHKLASDSGFNAIAYGYGQAESYGYSAGANVKDLYQFISINNEYATVSFPAACKNSPFFFSMVFPYQPTQIQWIFSGLFADLTINSPVYDSTWTVNGKQLYRYKLPTSYVINTIGTYPIKVIAQNPTSDGCSGEQEINYELQVFERPVADFNFTTSGCVSDSVHFTDNANTNGRTAIRWSWNFGDNGTSSLRNPAHLYTTAGSIPVKYSLITDIGCVSDTVTKTVILNDPPVAKFGVSIPGCLNKTISFTDSSTVATGSLVKWTWNFGDGSPQVVATTNAAQSHSYTTTGNFTITLKVESTSGCQSMLFSKTVTISPNPHADFSFGNACLPAGLMQFTGLSTITDGSQAAFGYQWKFGDNGTSNTRDPAHNYSTTGPFNATLVVTSNAGCVDSISKPVNTVYTQPQAAFTVPSEVCFGTNVSYSDQSNAPGNSVTQWTWNFGDGNTSTLQNPAHNYVTPGTYTVTLSIVSAAGCTSVVTSHPIIVNSLPQASFNFSSPNCVTKDISFTDVSVPNSGNIVKWTWDLGDGTQLNRTSAASFTHNYANTGTYSVTLKVETDKGCISTVTSKQLVIHPLPVPGFILPDNCLLDPFSQFTDTSSIADGSASLFTYAWNFGDPNASITDPNTSTIKNPKHKYSVVGPYNVSLTITSGNGCTTSLTQQLIVNSTQPQSVFTISSSNPQCSNNTVSITNNSAIDIGRIIRLEVYWDNANDLSNKAVITFPIAGAIISHSYPEFFAPASKTFDIRVVAYSGDNCSNTSLKTVTLLATPQIQFNAISGVCLDELPFQLTQASVLNGQSGNGVYSGNGVSATGIFNPLAAGVGQHTIRYTFTGSNGCINYKEQTVNVFPVPVINAGPDRFVLEGGNAVLLATSTGTSLSYSWTPNSWLNNPSILQPLTTPLADITYTIRATSPDGCSAFDSVFVQLLKTPSIPNVFTPNGDGINDRWEIKHLETYPGATIQIYNTYGQLVFESVGYSKAWDGTYKGKQLPAGTYYYIINPKNGRKQMSGFVDIVR